MTTPLEPLVGHHVLEFPGGYRRSLGPVVGSFLTSLRDGKIEGVRLSDGRVLVPPTEYDPATSDPVGEAVEVGPAGTVTTWTWISEPHAGRHPLDRPFAFALIRPDGADTAMLGAVAVGSPAQMSTGMRVGPRWKAERAGHMTDIECWVPLAEGAAPAAAPPRTAAPPGVAGGEENMSSGGSGPVTMFRQPIRLEYDINAGEAATAYLRGLAEGRLVGRRAADSTEVYMPPRGSDPKTGEPTTVDVEVEPRGTVTTFCIVNIKFTDLTPDVPYVCAQVLLDGAAVALFGLVAGCPATDVRMGMRVEVAWADHLVPDAGSIKWFQPSGEPDAPYDSYKDYL